MNCAYFLFPPLTTAPESARYAPTAHRAKRTFAFTLIELLIVLVVIAALAAILFPVFISVRENARRAACISNEHQLGMALLQYVDESDGVFNFGSDKTKGADWAIGGSSDWVSHTFPYLKNADVYRCPDDTNKPTPSDSTSHVISYAINSNLHGMELASAGNGTTHDTAANDSVLQSPSKTVMFFEVTNSRMYVSGDGSLMEFSASGNGGDDCGANGHLTYPCGEFFPVPKLGPLSVPLYATGNIGGRILNGPLQVTADHSLEHVAPGSEPRHGEGANYLACDGHAVWLRPVQVSGGENSAASDCDQGTQPNQPAGCQGKQLTNQAAGTSAGNYKLTFSIR